MKKYKILILSNMVGSGFEDDTILQKSFIEDGHTVDVKKLDYDKILDEHYDIIIRRNTWVNHENDTAELHVKNLELINRLQNKNIKTVNLVGLDGMGKGYLCDLFKGNENVIPTINTIKDLELLPITEKYVTKDIKSFGNGLHQRFVQRENLINEYNEGDIIQPFINFISEVQCYYVADKLVYSLEYTPSKYPHYPEPKFIELTETEKQLSDYFAKYSNLKYGFQRIDFLRLEDNILILMEIEDHAAFMNLRRLQDPLKSSVLNDFKENIYDYLNRD